MQTIGRKIHLRPKGIEAIAEAEGVSVRSVYNALKYNTNTETAVRIRAKALMDYDALFLEYKKPSFAECEALARLM